MPATAPTTAIGYTQAPHYNWWLYDNETTPELIWPQSIYVYDQMRRQDSQVYSVLRAVTETLLRTPWRIDPAGARPTVVKFVADDLGLPIVGRKPKPPPRTKDRFSWTAHLREALLMLPHGHSYFEQLYRVSDDGSAAHLRKLEYRPAKTIERIDVAPDGGLIAIKQYWTATNTSPKPIPVDRLVAYIHAREGGNWLGTSILRPAYKNWLLKDRLLRVQAQTIERNGMGIPLYKAQEGASPGDLEAGKTMATAWRAGEAAGSAVPFGADLLLRGVEGTLPDAEPVVRYHDEQIAHAVLAHFLNLGQQTGTGSYALGAEFVDFFVMSLQTLAEQIRDTANAHVVEDLVDINFGEDEPAPRLVFDEIGSKQTATAAALKTLVDAGIIHPDQVLEESSRQQYGLPPADPATATVPPAPAAPTVTPQAPTQTGDMSVAAAMADPKAVAAQAAPTGGTDSGADEDVAALYAAVAELEIWAAGFDPAKHARNPKGATGGGRFRSMVDRLGDALQAWGGGDRKSDPFEGFDREQLRRAAKSRGIALRRGAPRDEIAKALFDDLGGVKPSKPPVSRKESTGDAARFAHALKGKAALDAAPADHRYGSKHGTVELALAARKALDDYASDAQRINDQIRRDKMTTRVKATVRQIDKVMAASKLRSDVEVWRGVGTGRAVFDGAVDGDLTGHTWTETALVSTTADRKVAEEFAGMLSSTEPVVVMRVLAPRGTGAVAMSHMGSGGAMGDQAELLIDRGLSFVVVADHGVVEHSRIPSGVRLVDVEITMGPTVAAAGAADLDEEADDWEDAIDALIQALDELDGYVEAAWDPAKHPRNPKGSPGGGRFRSMVDRLKDAITEHRAGGGKGHPFDGFDREQLRRVAKARGIALKRGEDRDSIAQKLLEHLRGTVVPTQSHRRVTGTDQDSWVRDRAARVVAAIPHTDGGDGGLEMIAKRQGFDGPPDVVDSAAMDRAIADGWRELWRGVDPGSSDVATPKSARRINDEFRQGEYFPGLGLYGNGTYASVNREVGEVYAGKVAPAFADHLGPGAIVDGGLIRLALDPDARVGDHDVLLKEQEAYLRNQPQEVRQAMSDLGRYAAMRGYDAYLIVGKTDGSDIENPATGRDDYDQYVILNRTTVKVQREDP